MKQQHLKRVYGWIMGPCLIFSLLMLSLENQAHADSKKPLVNVAQNDHLKTVRLTHAREQSRAQLDLELAHLKHQRILKSGYGTLGGGIGLILVGTILINIDPYGDIGMGGFITAGIGVLVMGVGSFILGLFQHKFRPALKRRAKTGPVPSRFS